MKDSSALSELGTHVGQIQDEWLEHAVPLTSARVGFLLRLGSARKQSRAPRAMWLVAAALSLGAVLSAGAILGPKVLWAERPVSASVRSHAAAEDSWIRSEASEHLPIDFSDGSRITLEPGSRVRLAELRPNGATVAVEAGGLDVSVKHRAATDYRLTLGPFLVKVTGTRFNVAYSPERDSLRLSMREGSVVVSGCALGDPRPLRAGEALTASCRDSQFEISLGQLAKPDAAAAPKEPPAAPADGPVLRGIDSLPMEGEGVSEPAKEAPRSLGLRAPADGPWQDLARAGKFNKALGSLDATGFQKECERGSSAELSLMADVARFGKRPQQAILALSTLRRRFPGSAGASVAAFNLARVHFDQRGAYHEAARWFRTYLKEQPGGPLAREAQGRLMESLYRAGDREAAARIADAYLTSNPAGPHARLARTLLGR